MLEIRQIELGPLANFVYLLADGKTGEALVVDPAWDVETIRKTLDNERWKLQGIFLTHNHFDHINGVGDVLKFADVPIYIHKEDASILEREFKSNVRSLSGGEAISIGELDIQMLHTPGHTEGSLCFKAGSRLVTGDTLFIRGCGRVDLPNSDPEKMYASLKKIATLDESFLVFPGHNYGPVQAASIGEEKRENPFLRLATGSSLKDFLKIVAG